MTQQDTTIMVEKSEIELTSDEKELLRTCVRFYQKKTAKSIRSLRHHFQEEADTTDQEQRMHMLQTLYAKLSR